MCMWHYASGCVCVCAKTSNEPFFHISLLFNHFILIVLHLLHVEPGIAIPDNIFIAPICLYLENACECPTNNYSSVMHTFFSAITPIHDI